MTGPRKTNLARLRARQPSYISEAGELTDEPNGEPFICLDPDELAALIDTAEAATQFVNNANITTVTNIDGHQIKHGGTSTIHCHGDLIDRLRATLDRYTTE